MSAAAVPAWLARIIASLDLTESYEVFGVLRAIADPGTLIDSDAERLAGIRAVLDARSAALEEASR